jgi:hypothetical protein
MITNTFAAEYGRNAGSYVNRLTLSGTNPLLIDSLDNLALRGLEHRSCVHARSFQHRCLWAEEHEVPTLEGVNWFVGN